MLPWECLHSWIWRSEGLCLCQCLRKCDIQGLCHWRWVKTCPLGRKRMCPSWEQGLFVLWYSSRVRADFLLLIHCSANRTCHRIWLLRSALLALHPFNGRPSAAFSGGKEAVLCFVFARFGASFYGRDRLRAYYCRKCRANNARPVAPHAYGPICTIRGKKWLFTLWILLAGFSLKRFVSKNKSE